MPCKGGLRSVNFMIIAESLTKTYGNRDAVADVSFTVHPGRVTGFLGPNGAGKSTTMRMIVGLDRPTAGKVTVGGRHYRDMRAPLTQVGVLLDAKAVHTGRSARNHLRAMAATHGIPDSRVDEVLEITGLVDAAHRRAGQFSLGMGQRLGIATALLGDPDTLILDEPVNGLDPEGVLWVRRLVRRMAAEGRTVLLSSHLMSEMAQTADHIIVLGRGRILADAKLEDLVHEWTSSLVNVRTPRLPELAHALSTRNIAATQRSADTLQVSGVEAASIGDIAAERGIPLHELTPAAGTLEQAYLALTGDSVEYKSKELS